MGILKRSFDIVFALVLGVLLVPVFVAIVVALKLTSPGPLLFRQKRLGRLGKTFAMNKFRKFPADWGSQGPGVTLQFDSRMTKVGRVLERTKLDELPQLWNILKGEMSFVGPRPESLRFKHLFAGEFAEVLNYTPGIFGPNQTKYRNESAMYPDGEDPDEFYTRELFPVKARADIEYCRKANLATDLYSIISGVFAIFFSVLVWRKSMRASIVLIAWDVFSIVTAWIATHWLKYSVFSSTAQLRPGVAQVYHAGFLIIPVTMLVVFLLARVYRHPVRYFSSTDFYRLLGACCVAWMLAAITIGIAINSTSSLLLAISCIVSLFIMAIPRVAYQEWFHLTSDTRFKSSANSRNVLVCGVGSKSNALCNLLKTGFDGVRVVGLLTDDSNQVRREVHGFEVVGQPTDLDILHARYSIDQIWIGTAMKPQSQLLIDDWCRRNDINKFVLDELPGFTAINNKTAEDEGKGLQNRPKNKSTRTSKEPEVA